MARSGWSVGTTDSGLMRQSIDACLLSWPRMSSWTISGRRRTGWRTCGCSSPQRRIPAADILFVQFDHEKLDVYVATMDFVALAQRIIAALPVGHAGLGDQLRRAATSIALNIAEGAGFVLQAGQSPLLQVCAALGDRVCGRARRRRTPRTCHGSAVRAWTRGPLPRRVDADQARASSRALRSRRDAGHGHGRGHGHGAGCAEKRAAFFSSLLGANAAVPGNGRP